MHPRRRVLHTHRHGVGVIGRLPTAHATVVGQIPDTLEDVWVRVALDAEADPMYARRALTGFVRLKPRAGFQARESISTLYLVRPPRCRRE